MVAETGGVGASQSPGAPLPGVSTPHLEVRIAVEDASRINRAGLEAIVTAAKPAHVSHVIVLTEDSPQRGRP